MRFISYAQNREDVLLWRALRDVEAGFYIDVGAAHPQHDSVTLAFYERGWRGINIDPEPANIAALQAARPCDVNLRFALAAAAGSARFHRFPDTGWSTLDARIAALHAAHGHQPEEWVVETQTLAAICERHVTGDIHFLKVDVEGSEAQVIAGGDFGRFRPWIVVVEATVPGSSEPVPRDWESTLIAAGYKLAQFDGLNCFYVADEHAAARLPALSVPVNIFDDYISVNQISLARDADTPALQLPGFAAQAELEAKARDLEARLTAREEDISAQNAHLLAQETRISAQATYISAQATRVLAQETELQLMRAEAAEMIVSTAPINRPADQVSARTSATQVDAHTIFFDATLMIHHGFHDPVGIVRVEHYVAEYLAVDPTVTLHFVVFDREHNRYRSITSAELEFLEQILFHRHASQTPNAPRRLEADQVATMEMDSDTAPRESGSSSPRQHRVVPFWRWSWLRAIAALPAAQFEELLSGRARQYLPVRPEQSAAWRVGIRVARRVALAGARSSYHGLVAAAAIYRRLAGPIRRLSAPDRATTARPQQEPIVSRPQQQREIDHGRAPFRPGDTLLAMGNTWDYLDYGYLTRLVRENGLRFIGVVYDVAAMELPYVTPAPSHLYHRHWVEIGHAAERLIAISRFTAESFDRFIARPNGIDVPVEYAPLPNFLRERAPETGEAAVRDLDGRNFVIYCSTIEIRKNHVLLLNLWDELRQRVAPEKLPILVFVGKWGWSMETVRLVVDHNWRLRPHLRVMVAISDAELIWLYRHARFTVFPSLTEGFGLAAAESLSFGTPVIISDCPALLEATEQLMPAFHPHDFMGWLRELEQLILDDLYLGTLREAAARFRGPPYNAFAAKIRDAALTPPAPFSPHSHTAPSQGNEA
jgi:FkbM family methyltransferase